MDVAAGQEGAPRDWAESTCDGGRDHVTEAGPDERRERG